MKLINTLTSILRYVPLNQRQQLKALYQRLPGYGRKVYYAQYGEDAFLQNYFRQKFLQLITKKEIDNLDHHRTPVGIGFYVDVGAHSPVDFSNTYWFYANGWHGINIDAAPGTYQLFQHKRPRDTNLEVLISDSEVELTYYHWDTPFGVNTVSADQARHYAELYGRRPREFTLTSRRLDTILSEHLPAGQEISFLSVDVEGHDLNVLRSNDWTRFRPELVLVEDFAMDVEDPKASKIYQFMCSVDYQVFSWIRPTVVYCQTGQQDYLLADINR